VPKAKREKNCYHCEGADLIRMSFVMCSHCHRHFCRKHGVAGLDQCFSCLEAGEEM
jgi:hypothetical protein